MTTINDLKQTIRMTPDRSATMQPKKEEPGFVDTLMKGINEADKNIQKADQAIENFATGGKVSIPEAIIALEQADISFKFITQVRNKALEAYHEIMRLPV